MSVLRPLHLRSHYRITWSPKRKNAEDISLTSQTTKPVLKESQRSRVQFSYKNPYVHIARMVLAQKVDNGIVTY